MSEWHQILVDIDQKLFPHFELTTYQRVLYFHLIANTFAQDRSEIILTISQLSEAMAASEFTARKAIRELSEKGVVDAEQTRRGYKIAPRLPENLDLPEINDSNETSVVDIEEIDFFIGRKFIKPLIDREGRKCFYCLRNIVAACHKCNTRKQAMAAPDFLRSLFRRGLLSEDEFTERLSALEQLQDGELIPDIRHILI
ncbi:MAG: hypothetical protein MJH10_14030 [Epibacterium sp.]|nr:hypothetical protein [Epibacterium sp.]NQX74649.1 hypothetical protein [Epibacterium sp.]